MMIKNAKKQVSGEIKVYIYPMFCNSFRVAKTGFIFSKSIKKILKPIKLNTC